MFTLEPTDAQDAVIDLMRSFAADRVRPVARDAEADRQVPDDLAASVHDLGIFDAIPESVGGDGVPDPITLVLAAEELAVGDPALAFAICGNGMAVQMIGRLGTDEQQRHLLAPFTTGPARGSLLLYEGYGRRPRECATTIAGARLFGTKVAVGGPTNADLSVVIARREGSGELAAFAVPGSLPCTVVRDDAELGAISLLPARTATVSFDVDIDPDSALPASPLDVCRAVSLARLVNAAVAIGCGRAAVDYAAAYATERLAFGKPIAAFQGISFPLVDVRVSTDVARLELWHTAEAIDDADDADALERAVDRAVASAAESVVYATRTSVQVLGGHGFLTDHPVEAWYRAGIALATLDADPLDSPVSTSERMSQ